ncbi:hypothetical protein F0562_009211 [Nyssa sinensis]|uniref:Uncharacterized protein n=1 Tax=Nyssa sinensis TaxID=561372 RepID=A0A5J4ZYH6_9ASTE|nr:hypothetical protein F0562_009211 [Nyssa sinensis]
MAQALATPLAPSLSLLCNTTSRNPKSLSYSVSFPISTSPKFHGPSNTRVLEVWRFRTSSEWSTRYSTSMELAAPMRGKSSVTSAWRTKSPKICLKKNSSLSVTRSPST